MGHMHATESLDFLIVHKGQVTLHLDSGDKTVVKEGEVISESLTAALPV
jgi:quercetin dioxygenase-like cupin family protein